MLCDGNVPDGVPERGILCKLVDRCYERPFSSDNALHMLPLAVYIARCVEEKSGTCRRQLLPVQTAIVPTSIALDSECVLYLISQSSDDPAPLSTGSIYDSEEVRAGLLPFKEKTVLNNTLGEYDSKRNLYSHVLKPRAMRELFHDQQQRRQFRGSFTTDAVRVSLHYTLSSPSQSPQQATQDTAAIESVDDAARTWIASKVIVGVDIGKSCNLQAVALSARARDVHLPSSDFLRSTRLVQEPPGYVPEATQQLRTTTACKRAHSVRVARRGIACRQREKYNPCSVRSIHRRQVALQPRAATTLRRFQQ